MTTETITETTVPEFAIGDDVNYLNQEFSALDRELASQIDEQEDITGFGFDGLIPAFSKAIAVQPRTLKLPKPREFYLEPESPKRKDDSGNNHNQIHRGVHQVDPNRLVSWVGIMPNIELLKTTGNPFPSDVNDESIVTSDAYRQHQIIPYITYEILKSLKGAPIKGKDLAEKVFAHTRVSHLINPGEKPNGKCKATFKDTLRDLRLYGLLMHDKFSKIPLSSTFVLNPSTPELAV